MERKGSHKDVEKKGMKRKAFFISEQCAVVKNKIWKKLGNN